MSLDAFAESSSSIVLVGRQADGALSTLEILSQGRIDVAKAPR